MSRPQADLDFRFAQAHAYSPSTRLPGPIQNSGVGAGEDGDQKFYGAALEPLAILKFNSAMSRGGLLVLNDYADLNQASADNTVIFPLSCGAKLGTVIDLDWPCLNGIALSSVPTTASPRWPRSAARPNRIIFSLRGGLLGLADDPAHGP